MRDAGVYPWNELVRRGVSRAQVRRAVADGRLSVVRRGWYATTTADPEVVAAVAAGGVLSCVSALRRHAVWVPEQVRAVHVRANASQDRRGGFCSQHARPEPEYGAVDDLPIALRHSVRCLDDEGLVVVCDSILNSGRLTLDDLRSLLRDMPERERRLLDRCDTLAQSGTETMVRLRLRARNIGVRTQVRIAGVGRVDLLVGDRMIIETDGERFHSGSERFTEDRRRDREAIRQGYLPLRFTYADVVDIWDQTEITVLELVRARRHRWPRHR